MGQKTDTKVRRRIAPVILTKEEETELYCRWRDEHDEEALSRLTMSFQPMLQKLARYGMQRRGHNYDFFLSYLQEVFLTRMEKAHVVTPPGEREPSRFKPEEGRLATYMEAWLRGALDEFGRRERTVIRQPLERSRREQLERNPAVELLSVPVSTSSTSIDSGDEGFVSEEVSLALSSEAEQERAAVQRNAAEVIQELLAELPPRKRDIIIRRLYNEDEETLEEVGERHRVSPERIRQVQIAAKEELKRLLVGCGITSVSDLLDVR